MTDILVTSPYRPFTLPTQFKAVFNGYIYCGTVDAVDPSVSQVQVYLVNESGDKIPVSQPLRTNAGGFLVYNGHPAKFVTNSNHSLLVRDSLGNQLWYAPNMAEIDPAAASFLAIEALRRSYAEAGYNLVAGSFEAGGTLVNANDVLLHEASGKAFSGPAGPVAAGTNPASGGFIDCSDAVSGYSSVAGLKSGVFKQNATVIVPERGFARFAIVSGGTPNGLSTLDAGFGMTAELVVDGPVMLEWLGSVADDCKALFEHASQKYGSIRALPHKTYLFSLSRIFADTEVFVHTATFKNINTSGAIFCNGEVGNASYATGYDGDGNITFHGGTYDCNGVSGGAGFAGGFAFGHGRNIKIFDPVFRNAVGSHYVEINGCKDVYIVRPKVENHFFPTPATPGFYEDFQIDHMGSSSQFGFFGSYDGTPCDNIQIIDFDSDGQDVVVGTHTPTAAGGQHTNIKVTGISRTPKYHVVQAQTWKDSEIYIKSGNCAYDAVKMSGGCESVDVKVEQLTASTGGQSIVKCEEVIPQRNKGIKIDVRSNEAIDSANVIRLNKSEDVTLNAKVRGCYGSLLLSNDGSITDMDLEVLDGGKRGADIVSTTNTVVKASRMLLEGVTHTRPLRVAYSGLGVGTKIKLNGVTWADGTSLDGQPVVQAGVELNGHTALLSSDPMANTGTASTAHNCQNFSHFLVTTGTAAGGDLKVSLVRPYSFADYINKPLCVDAFSGQGTITFTNATTVTWTTPNPIRSIIGVNMA